MSLGNRENIVSRPKLNPFQGLLGSTRLNVGQPLWDL